MLCHPYTRYEHLYVYYLDKLNIPPLEHPDLIGVWVEDDHSILFFHTPQEQLIRELSCHCGAQVIYQADLDYGEWEAGVEISRFNTKTLTVSPVWEQVQADDTGRQEIVLDPSVIFGSGFHPTTRMCLETLELLMFESGKKIRRVADLGTGTGILAIAAAKLGAQHVDAIDVNPLACEVAKKNVKLNGCENQVNVECRDLTLKAFDTQNYDLVLANLYKGLLEQLFSDPRFWQAEMYMISGIIPAMEGDLLSGLPQKGIRFLHRANSNIWRLWVLGHDRQEAC